QEVVRDFKDTYGESVGIISGAAKHASLLMVTTSSSMGRSSVYNRLALGGTQYFQPVGYTIGWGHFHITDALFEKLRAYLRELNHGYADHHAYGKGPNWRLRTIKAALTRLGFKDSLLKHGIQRQVFLCSLAANTVDILRGSGADPDYSNLLSVAEVSALAVSRWMVPRGIREPVYRNWRKDRVPELVSGAIAGSLAELKEQPAQPASRTG
ncbi:MAG: DUF4338 domain-containing protein, partial [Mesorhizobium sp.]